jgi:pectate lyase
MKSPLARIAFLALCVAGVGVQAQDQCKPIGWATRSGRTGGATSVTGGGNATPIVVTTFADLAKYASDATPRVIHINGTLGAGWAGTSGDRLEIKSNKTIIGMKAGTILKACIHIKDASNVILRNIVVNGPGSNTDQAWDNINIEGSSKNIWVDHCEFWDGQDGNSDAVKGADNITYTWSIFGYKKGGVHNLSNLIASSDNEPVSVGKLNITFMGCWFRGINQRGPRCRYGNVHVVNNLYTTDGLASEYAVSAGFDCQVITENNVFVGTNSPIYTGHKAGTSAHYVSGNVFEGTTGNQTGYGSGFAIPYEYKPFLLPGKDVKAAVQKYAGATLASPTSCSSGPVGISVGEATEDGPSLLQRGGVLVAEGFATGDVEFLARDVSGKVLEHRWISVSSGVPVELDLSAHLAGSGLVLASVKAPGQRVLTARIQNLR